uniref:Ubiquitin-like domain-containing protein n=1 Tax=Lotharella oceanica TaxID=641309 RepID=A0A7S2TSW1_9EUKA|mmetsp:Transcript_28468/g.53354  ORF Transcript_28468/g.53354 Transcript_28468/m.53354 type:complete len:216 (+) Transcript_28468:88-735(+)
MQIFISGVDGKSITLDVQLSNTVGDVMKKIESRTGLLEEQIVLSMGGKILESSTTLKEHQIESEATLGLSLRLLGGHCQVPCGIFDDPKTVAEVKEAAATIRKAMVQINELSKTSSPQNFNQMTRWVMTKEEHCGKIITLMGEYCLCQRVKPVGTPKSPFKTEKDYIDALKAHHFVMVAAMKAKQTVDVKAAGALEHAIGDWCKMYLPEEAKSNL